MSRVLRALLFTLVTLLAASGCDQGTKTGEGDGSASAGATGPASATTTAADFAAATTDGPVATPTPATAQPDASRPVPSGAGAITASGLEYRVLTPGTGPSPKPGVIVRIHCRGWTLGPGGRRSEFIDTYPAGVAEKYVLSDDLVSGPRRAALPDAPRPLIPGLVEVITTMRTGEKREVKVPARLGYGASGSPPLVPGDTDLIFEVELVGIDAPDTR